MSEARLTVAVSNDFFKALNKLRKPHVAQALQEYLQEDDDG